MKTVWIVFVSALLFTSPLFAQTLAEIAPAPASTVPALKMPVLTWMAGVTADQFTTYWFSSHYGDMIREQNPLLRPLDRHPVLLVTAGAAVDAATGWIAYRLLGARHPRLAKAAFYSAAAYRGFLAAHNIHMMRLANDLRSSAPPLIR